MAGNEKTSPEIAKIAAIGIKDPGALTNAQIKKLAASALTQAPDQKKTATKKKQAPLKKRPVKGASSK